MKIKKILTSAAIALTFGASTGQVSAATLTQDYLNPMTSYTSVNGAWNGWGDVSRMRIDGKLGWCIEPQTPAHAGGGYNSTPSYSEKMNLITAMASDLGAETNNEVYTAALKMLHGEVGWTWTSLSGMPMSNVDSQINAINNKINQWNTKPSFNGQTVTVKYGQSVTLTDTNNVLAGYSSLQINSGNVTYSINGNKMTITPKDPSKASGNLIFERPDKYGTPLVWDKPNSQTIITQGDPLSTPFSVKLVIELAGNVRIQKLDKTIGKPIPNTKFHLKYTENGTVKEYDLTTGANGLTPNSVDILPDTTVEVWETSVPEPYKLDSTHFTGKIKAGDTITLTQKNVLMLKFPRTGSVHTLILKVISTLMTACIGLVLYRKLKIKKRV
ncbi:hypothetical protein RyT2_25220 [Pseudolactococcus yaeyamensis]